jgi:hypothetical protein
MGGEQMADEEASQPAEPEPRATEPGPEPRATQAEPTQAEPPPVEPDALLVDDLANVTDLRSKVSDAWRDFARSLAAVIRTLTEGTHLDLTLDPTASGTGRAVYEVSLQRHSDGLLGALAVSNAGLPEGHRLDRTAVAEMIVLGWSPPGVIAGSDKDFGILASVDDAARIAVTVTKTLRDVYGAPHPAFLTFTAHDEDDKPVVVAQIGSARASSGNEKLDALRLNEDGFAALEDPNMSLAEKVAIVVAGLQRTTPESLQVDSDGDIGIRAGSAMVFVRVRDNPALIDVFSPVLTEVDPSERLYAKLSEFTTKMPIGRLYLAGKTVWASVPVIGRDFQPTHLMLALQVMTGLADELDDRLHGEFGGKRFFVETDTAAEPKPDNGDTRTGMYL